MTSLADARRQALGSRYPVWTPKALAHHLRQLAEEFPDRPMVLTEDRTVTYAQMWEWSRRLARGLIAWGVRPGEHVALVMANYPELIALRFAIASVGAVSVPLNYLLRTEEFRYVLAQSDSVLLVTMSEFAGIDHLAALDSLAPGWETAAGGEAFPKLRRIAVFDLSATRRGAHRTVADLEADGAGVSSGEIDAFQRRISADEVAEIVYTSGTTGSPKGVMLTHDNLLRCAFTSAMARAFDDGHRLLFALPLYHCFGNVEGLLAATFVGGAIVPHLRFDPEATFAAIERFAVNEGIFVPTMTVALVEHPRRTDYDLSSLRSVYTAAAPAPARLWAQVRDELGVDSITTGYGQTEVTASGTITAPGDVLELVSSTVGRPKQGGPAAGPGLAGLVADYRTVDPVTGEFLADGATGELVVRGPQVMRGYYNKPEETNAVLRDGWLRTGDLGYLGEDGYLRLTGRAKELYKSGGELVAPKEVEEFVTRLAGISQAYAIGVPDDRWGEAGCVWIVPEDGVEIDPQQIIDTCKQGLARFKVPKHVLTLEPTDLPTTPTGKVQKFRLVEMARKRLAAS